MLSHLTLTELGWTDRFQSIYNSVDNAGCIPGRLATEHRGGFVAFTTIGELFCEVAGRLRFDASDRGDLPAVGDWVVLRPRLTSGSGGDQAQIMRILDRKTKFSRKVVGTATEEQVVAANIDYLFVVSSLTEEFNVRRIERYLTNAWDGGVTPVVVLTKADLSDDPGRAVSDVEAVAPLVDVVVTSVVTSRGIDEVANYMRDHQTVALVGSSGVGKSSLINLLLGEHVLEVRETRSDDRGRHTTTHRELLVLPTGGLIIDTPGMRELQLWGTEDALDESFQEIALLAADCRFNDCAHDSEPGCAVIEALDSGTLDRARFQSYLKLGRELAALDRRVDQRAALAEKKKWKAVTKSFRLRNTKE